MVLGYSRSLTVDWLHLSLPYTQYSRGPTDSVVIEFVPQLGISTVLKYSCGSYADAILVGLLGT